MSMKTRLSFGALVVVALLVAGLAYWAFHERSQPAPSSGSAGAPPVASQASAPPAPPLAIPQASAPPPPPAPRPSTPPAIAQSNQPAASPACHAAKRTRGSGARAGNSASLGSPQTHPAR